MTVAVIKPLTYAFAKDARGGRRVLKRGDGGVALTSATGGRPTALTLTLPEEASVRV